MNNRIGVKAENPNPSLIRMSNMTYSRENDPDLQPPKTKAEARRNARKDYKESVEFHKMIGGKHHPSFKEHMQPHWDQGGKANPNSHTDE